MSPALDFAPAAKEAARSPHLSFLRQWGPATGELSDNGKIAVLAARRYRDPETKATWQNAMAGFWDRFNMSAAFFELMRGPHATIEPITDLGRLVLAHHPAFQASVGAQAQREAKETLMSGVAAVAEYCNRQDISLAIEALAAKHGVSTREKHVLLQTVSGAAVPLKPASRQIEPVAVDLHQQGKLTTGRPVQPRLQPGADLATQEEWEARMGFDSYEVTGHGRQGGLVGMRSSRLSNIGGAPPVVEGRDTLSGPERLGALNPNPAGVGGASQAQRVDQTDGPMKAAVLANTRRTRPLGKPAPVVPH